MTELQKTRVELLKGMHNDIVNLGDESIYGAWILTGIPDSPDEDDFRFFATDNEEWGYICRLFARLTIEKGF